MIVDRAGQDKNRVPAERHDRSGIRWRCNAPPTDHDVDRVIRLPHGVSPLSHTHAHVIHFVFLSFPSLRLVSLVVAVILAVISINRESAQRPSRRVPALLWRSTTPGSRWTSTPTSVSLMRSPSCLRSGFATRLPVTQHT